ncbi:MAG: YraN family protein [Muribaculaceae bacterium]|nr:YraN family protein [Muribaculaceae bacterium]
MEQEGKKTKKLEAVSFGKFGEEVVTQEYIKKGYTILERNWKMGKTEIDIILQKESTIILVEVKSRDGKNEDALTSVTLDKRKRMIRAADSYIKNQKGIIDYRFDLATVTGTPDQYEIEIYEDAFVSADIF